MKSGKTNKRRMGFKEGLFYYNIIGYAIFALVLLIARTPVTNLENGNDVYLQISQENLMSYAPLFTLIVSTIARDLMRRPDKSTGVKTKSVLMILDEAPALSLGYDLLNTYLATLRSKNVVIMLIMQNMAQLEYKYGPIGCRSILGNCHVQVILGSNNETSSEVFSKMFGDKKVLKKSNTLSYSQNNSESRTANEAMERIFPPNYFGALTKSDKLVIYIKGYYKEIKKINCYKDR